MQHLLNHCANVTAGPETAKIIYNLETAKIILSQHSLSDDGPAYNSHHCSQHVINHIRLSRLIGLPLL